DVPKRTIRLGSLSYGARPPDGGLGHTPDDDRPPPVRFPGIAPPLCACGRRGSPALPELGHGLSRVRSAGASDHSLAEMNRGCNGTPRSATPSQTLSALSRRGSR